MITIETKIRKDEILDQLDIKDFVNHFGLQKIVDEIDSSEIIECIGFKKCLRIVDIDDAIEFVEENGFIVTEK